MFVSCTHALLHCLVEGANGQGTSDELQHCLNVCQNIPLHIHEEVSPAELICNLHTIHPQREGEMLPCLLTVTCCRCCSGSKDEEDFRPLFDNFVQDLLVTLHLPEWPAAELLLMLMGGLLVSVCVCVCVYCVLCVLVCM